MTWGKFHCNSAHSIDGSELLSVNVAQHRKSMLLRLLVRLARFPVFLSLFFFHIPITSVVLNAFATRCSRFTTAFFHYIYKNCGFWFFSTTALPCLSAASCRKCQKVEKFRRRDQMVPIRRRHLCFSLSSEGLLCSQCSGLFARAHSRSYFTIIIIIAVEFAYSFSALSFKLHSSAGLHPYLSAFIRKADE